MKNMEKEKLQHSLLLKCVSGNTFTDKETFKPRCETAKDL